jgi:hypothetical protein
MLLGRLVIPKGEQSYTTAGSYNFIVPDGVYSISFVVVGAGGGGGGGSGSNSGNGAGGGALAYRNNVAVTPGQSIAVVVGAAGNNGAKSNGSGTAGGNSSVTVGGVLTQAGGGSAGQSASVSAFGGSGGARSGTFDGGSTGNGGANRSTSEGLSGGGAGNYNGTPLANTNSRSGPGALLNGSTAGNPTTGNISPGMPYGGGGMGCRSDSLSYNTQPGGVGAVRIVWGDGLSFPNAAVVPA